MGESESTMKTMTVDKCIQGCSARRLGFSFGVLPQLRVFVAVSTDFASHVQLLYACSYSHVEVRVFQLPREAVQGTLSCRFQHPVLCRLSWVKVLRGLSFGSKSHGEHDIRAGIGICFEGTSS